MRRIDRDRIEPTDLILRSAPLGAPRRMPAGATSLVAVLRDARRSALLWTRLVNDIEPWSHSEIEEWVERSDTHHRALTRPVMGFARAQPILQMFPRRYAKISSVSGLRRKLLQALNRIGQLEMATICGISARSVMWSPGLPLGGRISHLPSGS